MHEELCFKSVGDLAKAISSRDVSPVELTKAYLDRIEEFDGRVRAVITVTRDHALQKAAAVEAELKRSRPKSALHGIPYGAKDLLDTKGILTSGGSSIFKDRIPDRNAAVIEKLDQAGAVMLAKLALTEFASGNYLDSFSPQPHNPWKLDRTPAGSSSGSGVATALGMAGFTIGSDTLGSIMGPSGANGVSGIRPTYSRVSRYGDVTLAWSLDRLGPLARSVTDLGLVLEAIAGHDPRDPTSNPNSAFRFRREPPKTAGLKIGVLRNEFNAVPEANRAVFNRALDVFKQAGYTLEETVLPNAPTSLIADELSRSEAGAVMKPFFDDRRIKVYTHQVKAAEWMAASMLPASDWVKLQRVRAHITKQGDELLERYAFLLAPNNASGAAPRARSDARTGPFKMNLEARLSSLGALAGLPGLGVPCGFDADGMPLGLNITGRAWGEQAMLDGGMVFQKETTFHLQRPMLRA